MTIKLKHIPLLNIDLAVIGFVARSKSPGRPDVTGLSPLMMTFHTSNLTIDLSAPHSFNFFKRDDMTDFDSTNGVKIKAEKEKYFEQQTRKQTRV